MFPDIRNELVGVKKRPTAKNGLESGTSKGEKLCPNFLYHVQRPKNKTFSTGEFLRKPLSETAGKELTARRAQDGERRYSTNNKKKGKIDQPHRFGDQTSTSGLT